jgi:hypothetical protein
VGGNGEDQLLRSISDMGELVILVVDGTNLVNEVMLLTPHLLFCLPLALAPLAGPS